MSISLELLTAALPIPGISTVDIVLTLIKNLRTEKNGSSQPESKNDEINVLQQTKVLRELAISRRIDTAEKVSIEEYYDTKGEGKAGVQVSAASVNIGLGSSGERVTKRVYTFEGWREGGLEGLDKKIIEALGSQADILTQEKAEVEESAE